jgi:hypothetical protein
LLYPTYSKVAGYTLHTFSDDLSELTTDYINANTGEVIHSFTVTKGQGSAAAAAAAAAANSASA